MPPYLQITRSISSTAPQIVAICKALLPDQVIIQMIDPDRALGVLFWPQRPSSLRSSQVPDEPKSHLLIVNVELFAARLEVMSEKWIRILTSERTWPHVQPVWLELEITLMGQGIITPGRKWQAENIDDPSNLDAANSAVQPGRGENTREGAETLAQQVLVGSQSERLTPTENEVAQLLANGLTKAEIAVKRVRDYSTVKTHCRSISRKWGLGTTDTATMQQAAKDRLGLR